ncbi:uncharacterized protein LOC126972468 [Leptidea sinapis]|uniref:Uncharacterized protein n=1 Tax=Leptidea sinapis TaxID=189913 RepID=A0A5E4QXX3_9NEOP|nr:uncharacterized protein LOC126972468 [Leptidea sinapis]VVD03271.1 unnamed protein product [Leptidea sinapis]
MNEISSIGSDISVDSLEEDLRKKSSIQHKRSEENVDTILVPFYEKDVLIKVPKHSKDKHNSKNHIKKEESKSFLINKELKKSKKASYLDIFRKQFSNTHEGKKKKKDEAVRSVSPQVGDTDRGSLSFDGEVVEEPDFYNTEVYNEMYYEKLIKQDMDYYLDNSSEELQYAEDLNLQTLDASDNNLKSVSEISQPRRHVRRATTQAVQTVKLGGLGPDMENLRPRLERARSLQRYSEKIRMENRLKIYKQSVEEERQRKSEQEQARQKQNSARKKDKKEDCHDSYLINKSQKQKSTLITRIYSSKKPSDKLKKEKDNIVTNEEQNAQAVDKTMSQEQPKNTRCIEKARVRSSKQTKCINTEHGNRSVTPLEINFSVTVGEGFRPSSALRTLEEKHKQYQERIRTFTTNFKNY